MRDTVVPTLGSPTTTGPTARRRVRAALTTGLIATAMLTAAVPSAVATDLPTGVVLHDGAGDVWKVVGEQPPATKVSYPPADVKRAVLRHGHWALRVRMRFTDLRRVGTQSFAAEILTPGGGLFDAVVHSTPQTRQGDHFFISQSSETATCPGMTQRIDYAKDLVKMRIPRSCLGHPRWVKVELWNQFVLDPTYELTPSWGDNPHNHGPVPGARDFTRRLFRE
jgi:hypothetical protein